MRGYDGLFSESRFGGQIGVKNMYCILYHCCIHSRSHVYNSINMILAKQTGSIKRAASNSMMFSDRHSLKSVQFD